MIKKSVFEDELIRGMQLQLAANEQSAAIDNLGTAVENLHSAVEVFEEAGMKVEADAVLDILLKFAKDHRKVVDPHTKGLTSEKMIANWKEHGSWFNADDGSADDLLDADVATDNINVSEPEDMDFEEEI